MGDGKHHKFFPHVDYIKVGSIDVPETLKLLSSWYQVYQVVQKIKQSAG